MSTSLDVGVFGVGSLGQWHARIYSEDPRVRLVGLYDVDPARADDVARRYGTQAFPSAEALADRIQAASIVVPTHLHHGVALPLLERGIHLLVEKPISATLAEAEEMVGLAERRDAILQIGHVERFNPVMSFLEQMIDSPRFIEAVRLAPYPPLREGGTPRGTEVSVVLDLMIHDLDVILHLVRSPVRDLHACGVPVLSPSEDIANARLVFENGCVANVTASRISQEKVRKIRVFQQDTYVSLDYQNQTGHLYRRTGSSIAPVDVPIEKGEALANELRAFVSCVLNRHEPLVSGRHASRALALAIEVCRLVRQGGS